MPQSCTGATLCAGSVFITANAVQHLTAKDITSVLSEHLRSGSDQDAACQVDRANGRSPAESCRKLYAYRGATGVKFWLISEADLSLAVLLPEDYGACNPCWAASPAPLRVPGRPLASAL